MFSYLRSLLFGSRTARPALPPAIYNPDPDYSVVVRDIPRYPPFDSGLPNVSIDQVLATQQTYINLIKAEDLPFALEAMRNLAVYVHLLPATSKEFFSGAGGLFCLCCETGYHSYVSSQGSIFTHKDPSEKRRDLEPKWQLAAFFAGLCCELGRAVVTSVVTNDRNQVWSPFQPLTEWLTETESTRYFLRPSKGAVTRAGHDPSQVSGVIVNWIVPKEALQYLATDDRAVIMAMLGTVNRINEQFNGSNHLCKIVRTVRDKVILRDQETNPLSYGDPLVGVHLEPYLQNAMRHLVSTGEWKINQKLARVHLAQDGCFIFWATGVQEILALLATQGAAGVPQDPVHLGQILVDEGMLDVGVNKTIWHWIQLPGSTTSYQVVKLANPSSIIDDASAQGVKVYPSNISVPPPSDGQTNLSVDPSVAVDESEDLSPAMLLDMATSQTSRPPKTPTPPPSRPASSAPPPAPKPQPANTRGSKPNSKAPVVAAHDDRPEPPMSDVVVEVDATYEPSESQTAFVDPSPEHDPRTESDQPTKKPSQSRADGISAKISKAQIVMQIQLLRDNFNSGSLPNVFWTQEGLAVSMEELKRVGETTEILMALHEAGTLYIKRGETKKIYERERNHVPVRCCIIKTDDAIAFGFTGGLES